VDANGNPVAGFFEPAITTAVTGKNEQGFTTAAEPDISQYVSGLSGGSERTNSVSQSLGSGYESTLDPGLEAIRGADASSSRTRVVTFATHISHSTGPRAGRTASESGSSNNDIDRRAKEYQLGARPFTRHFDATRFLSMPGSKLTERWPTS